MSDDNKDEGTVLNDEFELTLRSPVNVGGVVYESIKLCEPTAAQIDQFTRDIDKVGAISAQIKFISSNATFPESAAKKLKARDFKEAVDYLANFL